MNRKLELILGIILFVILIIVVGFIAIHTSTLIDYVGRNGFKSIIDQLWNGSK